MPTLVFDCDGVLSDTERAGHLPAFNQMFAEFDLPVRWSEEDYGEKLRVGGGKERLITLLTPEFLKRAALPRERELLTARVSEWHRRKTQIYVDMVAEGRLPGRPGVARLVAEAARAGWTLAVASTSAEPSVRAVLRHVTGIELAERFVVFAGDVAARKKPAPDIYQLAVERLGADRDTTLVVEDSRNGLLAATAAGLPCLVTVNRYTENEDFTEAVLVVTSLGDPAGEPTTVLANRSRARPVSYVRLDDVAACLRASRTSVQETS